MSASRRVSFTWNRFFFLNWSLLYSTILCSRADSPSSCFTWFWISDCIHSFNIHQSGVLTAQSGVLTALSGAMWNCCCFGAHSVYTIQPCTSLQCHFIRNHICPSVHMCLAVNLPPSVLAESLGSFTCYCGDNNNGLQCLTRTGPKHLRSNTQMEWVPK